MIVNQETGRSKGYGFIEFTSYKEFQTAVNYKEPIIFGNQKLVFNSAKNRYEDNELDIPNKSNIEKFNNFYDIKYVNNNEENINSDRSDSTITKNSSTRKDSHDSKDICSIKNNNEGFLGENKYPNLQNIYENEKNDILTEQIKIALKKLSNEFFVNNNSHLNKSAILNYYCGNFVQQKNI